MNEVPSLQNTNRYACLPVCEIKSDISSQFDSKAISNGKTSLSNLKRVRVGKWEKRLPTAYHIRSSSEKSIQIEVELETTDTGVRRCTKGLVDCGADGLFIDPDYVRDNQIPTKKLSVPIPVYNVDGSPNLAGMVKEVADLVVRYKDHSERALFAVTKIGKQTILFGYPWLKNHNPEINWVTKEVKMSRCPSKCITCHREEKVERKKRRRDVKLETSKGIPDLEETQDEDEEDTIKSLFEKDDRIFTTTLYPRPSPQNIRASTTISYKLAESFTKAAQEGKTFQVVVPADLHDFEDVFSKSSFDALPEHRQWDHAIELEAAPQHSHRKVYPLSLDEQKALDEFIEEGLASGRFRPSKSPIGAPVFFIKKKDGSLRLVQDYRELNAITKKNRYPLPLIDELIHKLRGARFFTKLDVRWGYNNVRIKEGDEWKAAFRTNRGLFEPLVMYFGLTNSPATFQTMMNAIFQDLITEGVVCVYLDDILIFTKTLEEQHRVTRMVLQRLREHRLFLRHDKCEFDKTQVEYLGMVISPDKVEMDPIKVDGVRKWPAPTNKKQVQSFLGFVNFYRRFIKDFSSHAKPLFELTRKDVKFTWGTSEELAFQTLKDLVTSSPVLIQPNLDDPFRVEADGSGIATGAVLSQVSRADGKLHPIAFLSKSLSEAERNYEIHDAEMLAIIRALESWRHFLEGAKHPFEIWTDHKNLEYFRTAQKLNRRQARWSLYLSRFNFTLHHRPGKSMKKSDALSRRADHGTKEQDNSNIILLKPDMFQIAALTHTDLEGEEVGIFQRIREGLQQGKMEDPVARAAAELKKGKSTRSIRKAEWEVEDGILKFRERIYVPNDPDLRRQILSQHHDSKIAGHPGRWKTLELVSRNYWWPRLSRFVASYVRGCDLCQRTKPIRRPPTGELHPLETPTGQWENISVDFIVELPESHGYDAIFNVIDSVTKRAHFIPTHTTITAEGAARLYLREVWKHHGLPKKIVSDRGPQFIADFMKEICRLLGIRVTPSTAYHPQTDGQTERLNQELEQFLRLYVSERQDDWEELLPMAEFAYNNHVHSSTNSTPFVLDCGRNPRMGFEPMEAPSQMLSANEFVKKMADGLEEAKSAINRAKEQYAQYYNRRRVPAPTLTPGDKVWLDASDIATTRPSLKLAHRRLGPYEVERQVGPSAYKLKLPPTLQRLHPVFPIVKLTPWVEDSIPGRQPGLPPEPVLVEGVEEFEVEEILNSRIRFRRLEYLVKWKGFDSGQNSWIPHYDVHAPSLVRKFYRRFPLAPRVETPRS